MVPARHLRLLAIDHLHVLEAPVAESAPRDRRPGVVAIPGLGVGEIQQSILAEPRIDGDVEQPALPSREHLRCAGERRGDVSLPVDDAESSRALRDDEPPIG